MAVVRRHGLPFFFSTTGEFLYSSFPNPMAFALFIAEQKGNVSSLSTGETALLESSNTLRIRLIRPIKILIPASATAFWIETMAMSGADDHILNFWCVEVEDASVSTRNTCLLYLPFQHLACGGGRLGALFFLSIRAFLWEFAKRMTNLDEMKEHNGNKKRALIS